MKHLAPEGAAALPAQRRLDGAGACLEVDGRRILAWVWIYFRVPETKGQSLDQIQQLWKGAARC